MPIGVTHISEPMSAADRAAAKDERASWDAMEKRIAELEARISALIAGSILPADGADEITVDGVKWVRVPAERRAVFVRDTEE